MSIFCNDNIHLSNKPECQQKGLNWSISLIPGPFIGYQRLGDLFIRVLSWSLFKERGAGELSAGNTRICSRVNKSNSRKGGRIQGGVEAEANLEGPLYPERPCVSGVFLMTSSWMGSWMALPVRYFLRDLVMGGISHNGSRHHFIIVLIHISLIIVDAEHLFTCLLSTCSLWLYHPEIVQSHLCNIFCYFLNEGWSEYGPLKLSQTIWLYHEVVW